VVFSASRWDDLIGRAKQLLRHDKEGEQRARQRDEMGSETERDRQREALVTDLAAELQVDSGRRQPIRFYSISIGGNSWLNSRAQMVAYLLCKLLQIANVWGQLLCLDYLLDHVDGMHYLSWVPNLLSGGWYTGAVNRSDISMFAVRVMCLVTTHARPGNIGSNERHDIVCDLPINDWNRLFFVGYWAWSVILGALTIVEFGRLVVAVVPWVQVRNVKQLLAGNGFEHAPPSVVKQFTKEGLGWSKYL
jgi:hypothetical protein